VERGDIDADLAPLIAEQRSAIERQRVELDRLDAELSDLDETVRAVGRTRHPKEAPSMSGGPIRVLFVCTGNSARSQIAEALLGQIGGVEFDAHSAGTEPKAVNPFTVRVLADRGIDWSRAQATSVTSFLDEPWDYVITVCDRARQLCPVFPGEHNSLHWGLDDPAEVEGTDEQKLAAFRETYMQLVMRIRPFVELARRARREATPVQG
jgi:arsenate reductase